MKKISILYLIDEMRGMAGAERNLLNIITHINHNRFRFFLYTFNFGPQMRKLLVEKDIECEEIPYPNTLRNLKKFYSLSKKIKNQKILIFHSYFEGSDIWGTLLAKLSKIPVIISSKRDMGFAKNRKILLAYRCVNPFVTKIISVSNAVKHKVHSQEKVGLKKITTIYNGLEIDKFNGFICSECLKQELNLNNSSPIVGVIANIRPVKGIEYFIHAASLLLKQFPKTQFINVGMCVPGRENEIYFEYLKSLVKELKLENNFFFLGGRSDIIKLLSILDISVLPSLTEGFSNTVIESMAAGKPMVVTDVGGNSEAVVNGKTGIVIQPRNANMLADAISNLLSNKALAKRMGEAGKKRVKQHFSIDTMIDDIENLYISTLNQIIY